MGFGTDRLLAADATNTVSLTSTVAAEDLSNFLASGYRSCSVLCRVLELDLGPGSDTRPGFALVLFEAVGAPTGLGLVVLVRRFALGLLGTAPVRGPVESGRLVTRGLPPLRGVVDLSTSVGRFVLELFLLTGGFLPAENEKEN